MERTAHAKAKAEGKAEAKADAQAYLLSAEVASKPILTKAEYTELLKRNERERKKKAKRRRGRNPNRGKKGNNLRFM